MDVYQGLQYAELREAHDRIYFGAWRGESPTLADLKKAYRQLGRFLDALERELHQASPPGTQENLDRARDTYREADPDAAASPAILIAINNTLSYGHRVLDRLLRAKGEGDHVSRDFALYYDGAGDE